MSKEVEANGEEKENEEETKNESNEEEKENNEDEVVKVEEKEDKEQNDGIDSSSKQENTEDVQEDILEKKISETNQSEVTPTDTDEANFEIKELEENENKVWIATLHFTSLSYRQVFLPLKMMKASVYTTKFLFQKKLFSPK